MRATFIEYYRPTDQEFQALWEKGLFVFDTNVLFNLYRYPKESQDNLFTVLEKIEERIWLPHQVAVEYQVGRLVVIKNQIGLFDVLSKKIKEALTDVSTKLQERQHAIIASGINIKKFSEGVEDLLCQLKDLRDQQLQVNTPDSIRDRIDLFFKNKIGNPPRSQKELDDIYKDGESRFTDKRPPGYMDDNKDKTGNPTYYASNLRYQRKYGDLVIWKQIIEKAASDNEIQSLIFVTDDLKEDWWLKDDNDIILGPRPELIYEALNEGDLEQFYMYRTDQFLRHAKDLFKLEVTNKSIEQIKDVAEESTLSQTYYPVRAHRSIMEQLVLAQQVNAVERWIKATFPDLNFIDSQDDDISIVCIAPNTELWGFKIIHLKVFISDQEIRSHLFFGLSSIKHIINGLHKVYVVVTTSYDEDIDFIRKTIKSLLKELGIFYPINIVIGTVVLYENGQIFQEF